MRIAPVSEARSGVLAGEVEAAAAGNDFSGPARLDAHRPPR